MSIAQQLLGQNNFLANASGIPIPFRDFGAITFVSWEDDGSTILTFTQHTTDSSTQLPDTETALSIDNAAYKAPGVGGTWTAGPTPTAGVYDLADDTTNDSLVITVRADQLSDDNEWVECTTDGVQLMAILHDPVHQLGATSLLSNIAL